MPFSVAPVTRVGLWCDGAHGGEGESILGSSFTFPSCFQGCLIADTVLIMPGLKRKTVEQ